MDKKRVQQDLVFDSFAHFVLLDNGLVYLLYGIWLSLQANKNLFNSDYLPVNHRLDDDAERTLAQNFLAELDYSLHIFFAEKCLKPA